MQETWSPARRTLSYEIEVDGREARVVYRGAEYGVRRVSVSFTRTGDGEWSEPLVLLDGLVRPEELEEVPAWLVDIMTRAQPYNGG